MGWKAALRRSTTVSQSLKIMFACDLLRQATMDKDVSMPIHLYQEDAQGSLRPRNQEVDMSTTSSAVPGSLVVGELGAPNDRHHHDPLIYTRTVQNQPKPLKTATALSMSSDVAAVQSGKFNLDDIASMESTSFYLVLLNGIHKTSRCHRVQNIAPFIRTRNRNFLVWHKWHTGANNEQHRQQENYQQSLNLLGKYIIYS